MPEPLDWPTRDLLSHRAAATPGRTALVDTDSNREWTYRALDAIVDGVTARIVEMLGGPTGGSGEGRVAIVASTRVGFVATLYASFRAGRAAAPVDTRLQADDLAKRIERVKPELVVCEGDTESAAVSATDRPIASLDAPSSDTVMTLQPAGQAESESVSPAPWDRDDTAVIAFTSGTSGRPKGVRLTLGNLVASATASAFRLGVAPSDRWLVTIPMFHMGGLSPAIRSPLYGTTLALQREFDAQTTAARLAGVTGVSLVPTQLKRLLDAGWSPEERLKTVLLGGAPASEGLISRALEMGVPVHPTYGLTETASQVATATRETATEYPDSVGNPLVFTEVTVIDAEGKPVEPADSGELVVSGPTVTPGYLDADRSEVAFGEYGLRTGDIARRDADGRLWIIGRADETVVTGGESVHPAEVVEAIRGHPAVDDAAVVGISDPEWGQRLAALVVPGDISPAAVEEFLRGNLPAHKVPKTIKTADELPRTASGTVDREAVREHLDG